MKTTDEICRIVSFGGGVIIDSTKTTGDLEKIAGFAKNKCKVIIKGAKNKTTDDLCRIGSFGGGAVIFDLTE